MSRCVKLPYMPLYVHDIESDRDCRTMSDAEFGRYMRLLIRQWVEGDVAGDVQSIIRDAMLDHDAVESVQSLLDRKFPVIGKGIRANKRLSEIRDEMAQKVSVNRENGRKGGSRKNPSLERTDTHSLKRTVKRTGTHSLERSDSPSLNPSLNQTDSPSLNRMVKHRAYDSDSDSELPTELDTPKFQRAWDEWQTHRREIRKTLTPSTAQKQLRKLAEWGEAKAIAAIEQSVRNGWTGLFDPGGDPDPIEPPTRVPTEEELRAVWNGDNE